MKEPKLKIVIPTYNAMPWLERCLESIADQSYKNFDVCVIDDASTDAKQAAFIKSFCEEQGWRAHFNEVNQGALHNIVKGINLLACEDEDVVIVIDGDDWLFNKWAFESIAETYTSPKVLLTYGQFVSYRTGSVGFTRPLERKIIRRRAYRKHNWLYSQLRTFKYFLWRQVKDEDLRNEDGEYYRVAYDVAMMFPMLEMAGRCIKHVSRILYVYNDHNPLNDHKLRRREQLQTELRLRTLPRYPVLQEAKERRRLAQKLRRQRKKQIALPS